MVKFDLLIKGGRVLDPASDVDRPADVAVQAGRIAAVEPGIPAESAASVVDARDQLVTPGLIDLHTHVFWGVTFWGVRADPLASRSGVTTFVDAGSAGAYTLPGFREFIAKPATARIYSLLNISVLGLVAHVHELEHLDHCDTALFLKLARLYRDLVVGVKVRMERRTLGSNGLEPLRRARMVADECGLPVMVHIAESPPSLEEVIGLMKPGDILTHCFTGQSMKIVDEKGKLLDAVKRAWDGGVVMDIGHGRGSFSYQTAEALAAAGHWPDVISTDLHQFSISGPMFDLPTCLSKLLDLGMPLRQVVRSATQRPAEVLGLQRDIGSLAPGRRADIALFRLEEGRFAFHDNFGVEREGRQRLQSTLTIVDGRPLPKLPAEPLAPWIELTPLQVRLIQEGHAPPFSVSPDVHQARFDRR
jgi:dihydroorotase